MSKAHESPRPAKTVVTELEVLSGPFLVVEGQYSPKPRESVRVGVLCEGELLIDTWMTPEDHGSLGEALRARGAQAREGHWDVMYATRWSLAWTADDGPFQLWDREGLLAWTRNGFLERRDAPPVFAQNVTLVEGRVSSDWMQRSLVLTAAGRELVLVSKRDEGPAIDPTYDAFNLLCDASWLVSLATTLASALDAPCELHKGLT